MLTTLLAFSMMAPATIYDFKVESLEGEPVALKKYRGKVLLVVNVASLCGLTPQYKALEALYEARQKEGLVILGFPANNFNQQEPGSNKVIREFCDAKYAIKFPLFSKISVKGEDRHPLYTWLVKNSDRPEEDIEWNFAKFIIGRDGKVVRRIKPQTTPDSAEVKEALDAALAAK